MQHPSFLALAFQAVESESDSSMLIIIIAVLVILFFIVVIIGVGLTVFLISRKRKRAQATPGFAVSSIPSPVPYEAMPQTEPTAAEPEFEAPPAFEPPAAVESMPAIPEDDISIPAPPDVAAPQAVEEPEFDPTRTVAIIREQDAVTIDYGSIMFTSGVLAGERFPVDPEGVYIGRESTLAQIVVSDPRISKRHLWIGVRDGAVKIVDEGSRNGTFVNDPRSERVTEAALKSGDEVIMGESDVARFEYRM